MDFALQYAHLVPHVWGTLEQTPRTGWVKRGIEDPETIAGHICSARELALELLLQIPSLSASQKQTVPDMIEIHDWPEYNPELGDIPTPELGSNGYMSATEKVALEHIIMREICAPLGDTGREILLLWNEFVAQETIPAQIAHQVDKLQPICLAIQYEEHGAVSGLAQEFFNFSQSEVVHPVLRKHLEDEVRKTHTIVY